MKNIKIPSVFSLILIISLNTGCNKEDPLPEGITIEDLEGSWAFLTLDFNGKTTLDCDLALNESYDFVTLDFYNVEIDFWSGSTYRMLMNTDCVDSSDDPIWQKEYHFTLVDSVINCNDEMIFKILSIGSYSNLDKTLKVKLINSSFSDVPLNGIYRLGKIPQ
jgi:hypothetical protein